MAFSKVKWIEPHANGSSKIQYGTVPTNWIEEEEGQELIRWPCNAKDVEPYIKRCQNPGINWLFFVLVQHFGSADSYINCESIKTCSESESDHNSQLGKRKYNQIDSFAYQKQSDDGSSCVYSYNNSATISSSEGLTCEKIINKEIGKSAGETNKDYISDQTFKRTMLAAIARLEKNFNDFKASFKQNDLKILVEPLHLSKLQFDEILDLEVFLLADSKRKDSAVESLCNVGGKSTIDITYNVIKRVMSDEASSHFNIKGSSQKISFCEKCPRLYSAIINAIKLQDESAKDSDITTAIGKWLRMHGTLFKRQMTE
ncbi:uncharacterized protein LOC124811044 isoform X2 [Hydra vulgaris]|uniref:uncharacterized protein LOC124811044 isoform X2 n=1 Tax=Hydra vulgaris TaxID=6087 RepID=UPI001F5E7F06|nr:uncharacterized protein LOC124811044 isoform X3 [Hydra vulgaris]